MNEKIEVTVIGNQTNAIFIKLPTREYPSVVLQGDSLSIIYRMALEISESLRTISSSIPSENECQDLADEMVDTLRGYMVSYEKSLLESKLPLPYGDPKFL